jgi:hypothetical protein
MYSILISLVFILSSSLPAEPDIRFQEVDIDTNVKVGYGLALEDVNGDGKKDIVLADKDIFAWYENPSWTKHVIATKLTNRDHVCLDARDINGDGKAEIAVGAGWNPGDTNNSGSVHFLAPGADLTKKHEAIKLHHEPTVHRMRWIKNGSGGFDLVVAPLHGRGNKGGKGAGVKLLAYSVPRERTAEWKTSVVDDSMHMTHNLDPVQWDDDPAEEILFVGREGAFLLDRGKEKWVKTRISENAGGEVRNGKLPDGKRFVVTIEPFHGHMLSLYTPANPGDVWTRVVLDDTLKAGHALACGDLLGVGHDQIVAGWRNRNQAGKVGIRLYAHQPDGAWKEYVVDDNRMACEDLRLADMNGDGKLDIVAAGRATKNLKLYLNQRK